MEVYLFAIYYFIIYQLVKKFYEMRLKMSHTLLNPFYNKDDFHLFEKIKMETNNKKFNLLIADTNINNEKFFSQILFKFFKPNMSIIDRKTWENMNKTEKESFLISEMKFRKINFFLEYLIYILEAYKIYNLIITYPYLRRKRLKLDNNLYEKYGNIYLQMLCKLSYENNINSVLYQLAQNFSYMMIVQLFFYDYFNVIRIYNLMKKNIEKNFYTRIIYLIK